MSVLLNLLFVVLLLFIYWCYEVYRKNKMLANIPGPPCIPFLGMVGKLPKDIYGVYRMFDDLIKTYGKTSKLYIGKQLHIVTMDINVIEPLLKSKVLIKKSKIYELIGMWLKDGLIISKGDKWRQRRKLCSPAFHFTTLKIFFPIIKQGTDELIDKLAEAADDGSVIDIIGYTSKFALDAVGETSLGMSLNIQKGERKDYIKAGADILAIAFKRNFSIWKRSNILFRLFSSDAYHLQTKSVDILDTTAMSIIKHKRDFYKNNTSADSSVEEEETNRYKKKFILVDALIQYEELSDEDILEEINNFLFAGHDTTAAGLAYAFCELSMHQDIQERLHEEISSYVHGDINNLTNDMLQDITYLDMVVKEVIRLRTPVPMIERELTEDAVLGGNLIPKGTVVSILLSWLHRDSDLYPEPEKFDPERFSSENQRKRSPFAFLPFSAGLRNCIGQRYAMMEMKTVLARAVLEFVILPVENFKYEFGMSGMLRSKHGFPIRLERRKKYN